VTNARAFTMTPLPAFQMYLRCAAWLILVLTSTVAARALRAGGRPALVVRTPDRSLTAGRILRHGSAS
jgi:hypothetical protein